MRQAIEEGNMVFVDDIQDCREGDDKSLLR
jgi:hypothetical protein